MSESPPDQPPLNSEQRYRTASAIVHSILDDRPVTANISPSGELYRAIERFHRNINGLREVHAEDPAHAGTGSSMSNGSENLRRRFNRDPPSGSAAEDVASPVGGPSASNTALRPPRSMTLEQAQQYAQTVQREAHERIAWVRSGGATALTGDNVTWARLQRLNDAHSHLRSLLDHADVQLNSMTPPPPPPPRAMSPPQAPSEPSEENRRVKRRRLDSDKTAEIYRGFRYGKYGQAEPGQLTMELVSCDGGLFMNGYAAENILKDDDTVYCTKGSRCNIVLRHQGSTVFSLKELIIKAPDSNFTSPVREGMVFIAMESDDVFKRTAEYQIKYVAASELTEQERQPVYSVRHDDNGSQTTRLPPMWASSRDAGFRFLDEEDDDEGLLAQLPAEFVSRDVPFNITTECTSSEGDTTQRGPYHRRNPYQAVPRIGALPFESDTSEEEGDNWMETNLTQYDALPGGPPTRRQARAAVVRARDHANGVRVVAAPRPAATAEETESSTSRSLAEAGEAAQLATQEAVRAVGGELMTPMVHFHIEKDNSKCVINFDPPISGRFLLLKMWSPQHDPAANIDIQGVIAKGFAGPRFCADVEFR